MPLSAAEREGYKIHVSFEHDCDTWFGIHGRCYSIVNACAKSVILPTQYMGTYKELVEIITEAVSCGSAFSKH